MTWMQASPEVADHPQDDHVATSPLFDKED